MKKQGAATPKKQPSFWKRLGPGLITGAADDDPSGIATYSQVGARLGFGILWSALFSFPLMVGIQVVSARIGRVTGQGLAANIRKQYPPWLLYGIVSRQHDQHRRRYRRHGGGLEASHRRPRSWVRGRLRCRIRSAAGLRPLPALFPDTEALTMTLLAYVVTAFVVKVPWGEAVYRALIPSFSFQAEYVVAVVAVFGTTISPYLFFWQASQEVDEQRAAKGEPPLKDAPEQARLHLERIQLDTYIGMGLSNLVAFFIMLTAAVTLHMHAVTDIQTTAQAAQALRPLAR